MRTGQNSGIWKALAAALLLHALVLLLPLTRPAPPASDDGNRIELDLVAFLPTASQAAEQIPEPPILPEPVQPPPEMDNIVHEQVRPRPPEPPPAPAEVKHDQAVTLVRRDPVDQTDIILSRQFITEESAADRLFGKPIMPGNAIAQREFHFPVRPDMMAMLDRPMQDLPFDYTPGLVHFAYAPGFRGDLQRFWDVITPEFGWRTNNGTEFRCVWLLVIAGCGWK